MTHPPDQPNGKQRFRADLAAHLNSLFIHEFEELAGELPEPIRVVRRSAVRPGSGFPGYLAQTLAPYAARAVVERRAARGPPPPEGLQ